MGQLEHTQKDVGRSSAGSPPDLANDTAVDSLMAALRARIAAPIYGRSITPSSPGLLQRQLLELFAHGDPTDLAACAIVMSLRGQRTTPAAFLNADGIAKLRDALIWMGYATPESLEEVEIRQPWFIRQLIDLVLQGRDESYAVDREGKAPGADRTACGLEAGWQNDQRCDCCCRANVDPQATPTRSESVHNWGTSCGGSNSELRAELALRLSAPDLDSYSAVRMARRDLLGGHVDNAIVRLRVDADKIRAVDARLAGIITNWPAPAF